MKVRDLLAQLAQCDPDAEVRLATREPVSGVVAESQLRRNEGRELGSDPEIVWLLPGSPHDRAAES